MALVIALKGTSRLFESFLLLVSVLWNLVHWPLTTQLESQFYNFDVSSRIPTSEIPQYLLWNIFLWVFWKCTTVPFRSGGFQMARIIFQLCNYYLSIGCSRSKNYKRLMTSFFRSLHCATTCSCFLKHFMAHLWVSWPWVSKRQLHVVTC